MVSNDSAFSYGRYKDNFDCKYLRNCTLLLHHIVLNNSKYTGWPMKTHYSSSSFNVFADNFTAILLYFLTYFTYFFHSYLIKSFFFFEKKKRKLTKSEHGRRPMKMLFEQIESDFDYFGEKDAHGNWHRLKNLDRHYRLI